MTWKDFESVFKDMEKRFNEKNNEFHDSWKNVSPEFLLKRIYDKEMMHKASGNPKEERKQVIDLLNLLVMRAKKLEGEIR